MYPLRRNRRLRANNSIRNLVRETILRPSDFLVPLFVVEGHGVKEEIPSMPNYYRLSLDNLGKEVNELWSMGLCAVLLFVKVLRYFVCKEIANNHRTDLIRLYSESSLRFRENL